MEDRSQERSLQGGVGMSDGVQGTVGCIGDCWTAVGTSSGLWYYTLTENIRCLNKHCMFSGLGMNAFRMGSSNLSFAKKSCTCASIAFLAGIFSWATISMQL